VATKGAMIVEKNNYCVAFKFFGIEIESNFGNKIFA